jgi:hypothetical protein
MQCVHVEQLLPVSLWKVKVNRADSGSPQWKCFYFPREEDANTFYQNEHPENRHSLPVQVDAWISMSGDCYLPPN